MWTFWQGIVDWGAKRTFSRVLEKRVGISLRMSGAEGKSEETCGKRSVEEVVEKSENGNKVKRAKSVRSDRNLVMMIDEAWKKVFGVLGLDDMQEESNLGKTRCRNHVNPLASGYQKAIEVPDWGKLFADPSRPLFLDVGCAQGRFGLLMGMNEKWKDYNHLGVEIRAAHVQRANHWASAKKFDHVHFLECNFNTSVHNIMSTYPGEIEYVAMQFPDPHFKRKHHKRRVLTFQLVEDIARYLKPGAKFFMQSDVEEVVAQMRDRTDFFPFFKRVGEYTPRDSSFDPKVCRDGSDDSLWTNEGTRAKPRPDGDYGDFLVGENPIGIPTEREVSNKVLGKPVYRVLFERTDTI